jgi:small basic protein (TIGR04137 family)
MSMDASLKSANSLIRHRNVLTRAERLDKLAEEEKWNDKKSVFGLPKVAHRKMTVGGKADKEEAAAEGAAAGAAPAAAGAAAPGAKGGAAPAAAAGGVAGKGAAGQKGAGAAAPAAAAAGKAPPAAKGKK